MKILGQIYESGNAYETHKIERDNLGDKHEIFFKKSSEDWILQGWEDEEGPKKMIEKERSIMLGVNQDWEVFWKSSEGSVSKRRNWGIRTVKRSME